jgi:hypothetical protein
MSCHSGYDRMLGAVGDDRKEICVGGRRDLRPIFAVGGADDRSTTANDPTDASRRRHARGQICVDAAVLAASPPIDVAKQDQSVFPGHPGRPSQRRRVRQAASDCCSRADRTTDYGALSSAERSRAGRLRRFSGTRSWRNHHKRFWRGYRPADCTSRAAISDAGDRLRDSGRAAIRGAGPRIRRRHLRSARLRSISGRA